MNTIPTTTTAGNWLHFAVEATGPGGTYILGKTHILEVALAILDTRVWPEEDDKMRIHGNIIPYDAKHEESVWLGFNFHHKGAKEAVAQMGHYAENVQEAVLSEDGYRAIWDRIREKEREMLG
jgi:hypothetical protein